MFYRLKDQRLNHILFKEVGSVSTSDGKVLYVMNNINTVGLNAIDTFALTKEQLEESYYVSNINYIGLNYNECKHYFNNINHRIAEINGKPCVLPRDFNHKRLNLWIEDNIIIRYEMG